MPSVTVPFGLIALSAAALAQTTVMELIMPAWDPENLVGSVVAVEKSITTYVFECKEGTDETECGLPMGGTMIQGESTWSQSTSFSAESEYGEYILTYACDLDKKADKMVCEMSQEQTYDGTTETTTTIETISELSKSIYQSATITGGLDKLDPSPGASTTAPETTETKTETETSVTTATATESDSSAEPTGDSAEETESNSDNAGPRATQNAVIAGVAGILGAAAVVMY